MQLNIKIVERDPNKLKFDPNQPRKEIKKEWIEEMSKTYTKQGIINDPEIDENNVVITGEIRVKSALKKGLRKIKCKQITGLDRMSRLERQAIENFHQHGLGSVERERVIKELHDSKNYTTHHDLANILGVSDATISATLRADKVRKETKTGPIVSTRTIETIGRIKNKDTRKKLARKAENENIGERTMRKIVKIVKEIEKEAPELEAELLKPETKITEEKLEEVKKIAKMPKDVRTQVIKKEISVEDGESIAEVPKIEMRKEAVEVLKRQKRDYELTKEYIVEVGKGNKKAPTKVVNLDTKIINQFNQIYKQVIVKMTKRLVDSYNTQTKTQLRKIMKATAKHIITELDIKKELEIKGDIINVEAT
ncbi:hypothetical protein LCGC14_2043340 [marine sediment metagenome]|uniref:ParB-like N-terminal domain-containing protein n=1 Tax=marine sediment metagenome TaxID=412755 RepID=A0A0F9HN67_9ZZZZ